MTQMTVVDVSRWQVEPLDWHSAVDAGLTGVIVKVSQGTSSVDPRAVAHITNARLAGVKLLGAYHFGNSEDPAGQAQHFLDAMRAAGLDPKTDLMVLDLERNLGSQMDIPEAEEFVEHIRDATGRLPVLYMGRFGPTGDGGGLPSKILSQCDLMLPAYGPHPNLDNACPPGFRGPHSASERGGVVRLWQFTDGTHNGGPFPGLGRVDQSRVIGFADYEQLSHWWNARIGLVPLDPPVVDLRGTGVAVEPEPMFFRVMRRLLGLY